MKKNKGILILVITLFIIMGLGFTSAFGIGKTHTGAAKNINLGLDLAGGVSITYQAVGETPTEEQMKDTVYKLQKRVENYSTESEVYQEGDDRINVEIPGVSDANTILEELGKPGSLQFQDTSGNVLLEGSDIATAEAQITQDNMKNKEYVVALTLTDEGATKFAEATAANLNQQIPIVFDGEVISSPVVQTTITGGQASITGMESYEAAETLASTIRIGSLKVELEELRSNVVGARLGQEAIKTSLTAGAIGLALVIIFMCAVYWLPGLASGIALLFYITLELVILNAFDITLTLPGIAGIILSIGMAVDANVIIFARVREELTAGKSVRTAIDVGFKKAMSAIIDGNITTLIAAIVLGLKGTGTVKGFAQTLAMGVVLSMFTALIISKYIMRALYAIGFQDVKYYGMQKERKTINFLSKKYLCMAIAVLVIIAGFGMMALNQSQNKGTLNFSLEFIGGTSSNVTFNEELSLEDIEQNVKPLVESVTNDGAIQTQKVTGTNQVIIKTRELNVEERESLNNKLIEKFGIDKSLITVESISSTISSEMKSDALVAVIISTICMLIYIWFRFKDIRFATSAVIALINDVLAVLAFYAISRVSVGGTFIACMLTIVGYSINATIVIFDRIRENLTIMSEKKDGLELIVNISITQTLTRSIYTSFTTFITIFVLYILGVTAIKEFALPLIVGIVYGAFSSVCITGALWYLFKTKLVSKKNIRK
ncbi:protein translocase subunit SecD [Lachnotalea glycerini]|uniref:Multifunctional fusion protein n=1 Tax=Lachnotalea glycerini TaxID=1763509 RepID=A0A371JHU9_9FIRM|nr:protein translocase subunit SecD [Lachnotalea glycerini]RDY32318.1 protein translocase subunit SecD [Lachnotalea glycerini]